jgi:TRAP-type C4-dicarboxylate transport system substrate-binding protein
VTFQRKKWDEQEAKSLEVVTKGGATIVSDVDKASFRNAMAPVYAKFISTPDLQRLVKSVQDSK